MGEKHFPSTVKLYQNNAPIINLFARDTTAPKYVTCEWNVLASYSVSFAYVVPEFTLPSTANLSSLARLFGNI